MKTSLAQEQFVQAHPKSQALAQRARDLFPDGVTHDGRMFAPFPMYIDRLQGAKKWCVDGHEYVCYVTGHGASILGHSHPEVVEAVQRQVALGSHASGSSAQEIELAELILKLFPSAEKLRFTNSGTEANMMAVRLARAATGRPKLVKLQGNFHGWADALFAGIDPPFEMPSAGLPPGVHESVITLPTNDVQALENALSNRDVAAFIIEGAGAHMGTIPTSAEYARAARELCTKYGTIFIIDEVVSGFRWAPGGWQETIGVEPDISTMAKVLMGAMPGGCVAGKEEILNVIQHTGDAERDRAKRMPHPGTFNANPVSVAAGIACLKIIATGEPHRIANAAAETLRQQMHAALQERGISGFAYGDASMFHVYLGDTDSDPTEYSKLPAAAAETLFKGGNGAATGNLRKQMLYNGVDCWLRIGICSMAHDDEAIEKTMDAFNKGLDAILEDGVAPLRS